MQSIATTKKYYFIGTAAILFILVYKISDDIGELKIIFNSILFSFNVIFDSRWHFCLYMCRFEAHLLEVRYR